MCNAEACMVHSGVLLEKGLDGAGKRQRQGGPLLTFSSATLAFFFFFFYAFFFEFFLSNQDFYL